MLNFYLMRIKSFGINKNKLYQSTDILLTFEQNKVKKKVNHLNML